MGRISIVDVGAGNIRSIHKALSAVGAEPVVATDPRQVAAADKVVLPGVGQFDAAMSRLQALGFVDALHECARVRQRPVLGICLGMHLMACRSEEGTCEGLGWLPAASVVRFRVSDPARFKVPQIGWNAVEASRPGLLLRGAEPGGECYFSHSYHLHGAEPEAVSATTTYDYPIPSMVEAGNLFGVQFHPEKSGKSGASILRNFQAL